MKKKHAFRAVGSTAAVLTLALAGCNKPAPGLVTQGGASASSSVYGDTQAGGTSVSAPTPTTAAAAPASPGTPTTSSAVTQPPPVAPEPKPEMKPEPAPAPVAAAPVTPPPAPAPEPAAPAPAGASGPKIMVKPEMPKALFVGTPLPSTNAPPNLDVSGKPVLEVAVPEGVTLLSKGKTVTSSDSAPIGELSLVTDGDKQGDDGYFVDLMPGKTEITIDLGESKEIWLIWTWHFHKQNVIYKDVVALVSDDPSFTTATTVFNNDWDNSAGFGVGKDQSYIETNNGRPMPVNGVKGRYVRLWSNGRDLDDTNQYIEVEVYGK